jgi:hypothetical protein
VIFFLTKLSLCRTNSVSGQSGTASLRWCLHYTSKSVLWARLLSSWLVLAAGPLLSALVFSWSLLSSLLNWYVQKQLPSKAINTVHSIVSWTWFLFVGCNTHRCLRQLGIRQDQGYRLGMGWCYLALQHCVLFPARCFQVLHPLRAEWKGLGQPPPEQGTIMIHIFQYSFSSLHTLWFAFLSNLMNLWTFLCV